MEAYRGWIFIALLMVLPIFRWAILYELARSSAWNYSWVTASTISYACWGFVLATALGQGTLIAAAMGWWHGSIVVRSAVGIVSVFCLALMEGIVVFGIEQIYSARPEWSFWTCVIKISCCALLLLPLHILPALGQVLLARLYGIEIQHANQPLSTNRPWQIRLIDLMALTMLISLGLGLGRSLVSSVPFLFPSKDPDMDSLRKLFVIAAGNFFMLNALITCFHVRRRWWVNLLLVCMIAILISAIQSFSLWWFEAPRTWRDGVILSAFCLMVNLGHLFFVLAAWWALRRMGYQLERRERKVKGNIGPSTSHV